MVKKLFISLVVLFAITTVINPLFRTTGLAAEVKTLKIGCSLPLNVSLGLEMKKYLEILVPRFNEAGGLVVKGERYNIEMIIYDDKYTAEGGRAAFERLVHLDKVKFIVGNVGSAPTVAGLPISEANGVITFCGAASPKIIDPKNRYTARTSPQTTLEPAVRTWIMKHYPIKTMVTLSPDDETGKIMSKVAAQCAEAYGAKILDHLYYPRGTTDYSPIATKIRTLNPDDVNFAGSSGGTDVGLQLKELYRSGWRGMRYLPMLTLTEVASVCTNEQMEGAMSTAKPTDIESPNKLAAELKDAYIKKYGTWNNAGVMFTTSFYAFIAAVGKANSLDKDDIMSALRGLEFDSPGGYCKMIKRPDYNNDKVCDVVATVYVGQIKNGKLVTVGVEEAESAIKGCEKIFGGKWK